MNLEAPRLLHKATKKIFNYILENYPSYSAELTKVMELQELIQNAYAVCQQGRKHLNRTGSVLTVSAFNSMSKHRKRLRLLSTLDILAKIKTMQTTDIEIQRMLEEEDVVNAIRLCLECKSIAALYREYSCISDLSLKLQTTLINIERHLDNMLASCTVNFESERFNKVVEAYKILARLDSIPEKVIQIVQSAIEDTCSSVIIKYLGKQFSATEVIDKLQHFVGQCKI
uniref:Vacuolar protein sorting-associated protein 54 N-terminal domain-containing protein n=1 Tax=Romanomermis culicivorax TaxID=13658 RepID=A0A915IZA5_ROMCU